MMIPVILLYDHDLYIALHNKHGQIYVSGLIILPVTFSLDLFPFLKSAPLQDPKNRNK